MNKVKEVVVCSITLTLVVILCLWIPGGNIQQRSLGEDASDISIKHDTSSVTKALTESQIDTIKNRFEERRTQMENGCQSRKHFINMRPMPLESIRHRCEVLEKHNIMYCVVFKAGSTALNSLIASIYNQQEFLDIGKPHQMMRLLRPRPPRFKRVIEAESFLKMMVVREPLSRFLSAYRNRIETAVLPNYQVSRFVPRMLKYGRGESYKVEDIVFPNKSIKIIPTFDEFARYVVSTDPVEHDWHWMPLTLVCGVCAINYTHIIHMETYTEDVKYILRETGTVHLVNMSLLITNDNKGQSSTIEHLVSYYSTLDPLTLQQLVNIYKDDFILFGYDPTELLRLISPSVTIKF